jgi:hypothetical protein
MNLQLIILTLSHALYASSATLTPDATPPEESAFKAIYRSRPQKYFGHNLNIPKYFLDF